MSKATNVASVAHMSADNSVELTMATPVAENEHIINLNSEIGRCQIEIDRLEAQISEHNRVIGFIIRRLNGEKLSAETGFKYLNRLSVQTLREEKNKIENHVFGIVQDIRLLQQDIRLLQQDIRDKEIRQHDFRLSQMNQQRHSLPVSAIVTGQSTKIAQGSASTFCNNMAKGLGYLPLGTAFDPTHGWTKSLTSMLIPLSEDVQNVGHFNLSVQTPGYGSWKENQPGGAAILTMVTRIVL